MSQDEELREAFTAAVAGDPDGRDALERLHVRLHPAEAIDSVQALAAIAASRAMDSAKTWHEGAAQVHAKTWSDDLERRCCEFLGRYRAAAEAVMQTTMARAAIRTLADMDLDTDFVSVDMAGMSGWPKQDSTWPKFHDDVIDPTMNDMPGSAWILAARHDDKVAIGVCAYAPCASGAVPMRPWRSLEPWPREGWYRPPSSGPNRSKSLMGKIRAWGWSDKFAGERNSVFRTTVEHMKAWVSATEERLKAERETTTVLVKACQGCGRRMSERRVFRTAVRLVMCHECRRIADELALVGSPI